MKKLYFIALIIFSLFVFSCGNDKTEDNGTSNKCKNVNCTSNAVCNPNTGKCECKEGYVQSGTECIKDDGKCENANCPENSSCNPSSGECECREGYVMQDNECKEKNQNSCENIECGNNEICESGKCKCKDGYFYSNEFKQCILDEDCQNVTCNEGETCAGGVCYKDNECSPENPDGWCPTIEGYQLVCKNGICITQNSGSKNEGENCNPLSNECKSGTVCVDKFNDKIFKCRTFCDLTIDNSCGENGFCAPYMDDYIQNTGICIKNDPECNDNTCPDGYTCETMINAEVCKNTGSAELGELCDNDPSTSLQGCKEGLFCVGDEGEMKCRELCDPEQEDQCQNGRCVSLMDINSASHNNDIGICADIPKLCDTSEGALNNPSCDEDAVCLGGNNQTGACFSDTCNPNDENSCSGELEKCTRSATSKYNCIPAGNLEHKEHGCVNPKNTNVNPEDIIPSKLCKQGLVCLDGECREFCDPSSQNPCSFDNRAHCVDFHIAKPEYPAGINGICISR